MYGDWCATNDHINSSSFLGETMKLKLQQEYLDKACSVVIKNIKHVNHSIADEVITIHKEKENERLEEQEKLNNIVFSTLHSLKQLKNDVKNEDKLRELDVESYRKSLVALQNRIKSVNEKSEQSLQKLLEEEKLLLEEMQYLENKFNEWNEPVNPSILKPIVRSVAKSYISNMDNTRQEVVTFQQYLQDHGGHTGGWNEEDHLLFLRMRNKNKGKETFLSLLRQHLPDIPADKMLLHEEWYQQYENLKSEQKKAIQEWKDSKSGSAKEETKHSAIEGVQQRNIEPREDIEKKKQMILEWKQTLQLKKELENKKEWDEKQKELEREHKRREKQEIKKAEVERYKQEKLSEQHTKMVLKQLKELRELEERAAQADILLKAFQKQDQMFMTRQLNRREQRALKEEERLKHIQNLKQKIAVERNPSRLLQSTEAWRERCRQNLKPKTSSLDMPQLHLRNMPHLHVPDWRRDVM